MAPKVDPATHPHPGQQGGQLHDRPADLPDPVAGVHRTGRERPHHGRRGHPPGGRDLEPAAADPGQGPAGGRHRPGLEGRRDAARAAAYGRGPRPEPGHRQPEVLGHDPVRRQDRRLLPQVPGRPEPPERHPAQPAQRPGRAAEGQRRAQHGEAEPLGEHGSAEPVHLRRRAAGRQDVGQHRRARALRPGAGQGTQPGRALLRPAEAPGPADPARGVDPELPGHRHHHQEQHRADQGRRPRLHDDGLGAADGGHRRAGPRQPEAGARPDHRA